MSLVYWDTMLFIYWLEDKKPFSSKIERLYNRMMERGDTLCSSTFGLGELLVGPKKTGDTKAVTKIQDFYLSRTIKVLEFTVPATDLYSDLRAKSAIKPPDAIHLACAGAGGVDLFLTNDQALRKLTVPGIKFIDGIDTSVLA